MLFPGEAGRGKIPLTLSLGSFLVLLGRGGSNSGFAYMENTEINQVVRERFSKHSTTPTKTMWEAALLISFCSFQRILFFSSFSRTMWSPGPGAEGTAPFFLLWYQGESWRSPKNDKIFQAKGAGMTFPWILGLGIIPLTFPEWGWAGWGARKGEGNISVIHL